MPQFVEPLWGVKEPPPNRIRWTRTQCEAIRDAGVLTGRYELIDGEIISKMGQNPPHRIALVILREWLTAGFGGMHVQVQSSIEVDAADPMHNEPEPDAAVTAEPATAYPDGHPGPADLLLVVEVSDTTLRFDRITKALLYARAGIHDYWVLDLVGRQLFVHRQLAADGYMEVIAYAAGERAAPLARPEVAVLVAELLPPAS